MQRGFAQKVLQQGFLYFLTMAMYCCHSSKVSSLHGQIQVPTFDIQLFQNSQLLHSPAKDFQTCQV
jgi:hypothetical protein